MLPNDERGKLFTEVVHKEGVKVVIQTRTNKIRATLHKQPDHRMIDRLNKADKFLPLTQVTVFDEFGKQELHQADFLAINCNEIIWLIEEPFKPGTDEK